MKVRILRRRDILKDYHYALFVNSEWIGDFDTYEEAAHVAEEYLAA